MREFAMKIRLASLPVRGLLIAVACVALSACSTTTGIVPIGSGLYMLGAQDGWAYTGSSVKAHLYGQATEFCAKQGKEVQPLDSTAHDSGTQYATAEIQFRCVSQTTLKPPA